MSITIRDVAKLAGVSVSTASLALNNKGYLSSETKAKVLEAAKKLGYMPSMIARKFATGKTNTVGIRGQEEPENVSVNGRTVKCHLYTEKCLEMDSLEESY